MRFDIGEDKEPKVYAKLVINHGTLQLELTDHKGESNIILGISPDGRMSRYALSPHWAESVGIQIDENTRIVKKGD